MAKGQDRPNIWLPPPAIYAVALGLAWYLDTLVPAAALPATIQYVIGGVLIMASFALIALTLLEFKRHKTMFSVYHPTDHLITTGPLKLTRNPGYLAMTLLCAGVAIAWDNMWALALTFAAAAVTHFVIILPEERYLERRFGGVYTTYKSQVRRWI